MKTPMKLLALPMALILGALVISCGTKSTKETTGKIDFTRIDSLRSNYLAINDSMVAAWHRMIKDDNQKLSDLNRLLDEITFTNNYDKERVEALRERIQEVKALRYNQQTMADSELIDEYDFASDNLVNEIITFAQKHPQYERYKNMEMLVDDIRTAHEKVLYMRVDYDRFAKQHNRFITENNAILEEIDNSIEDKKKPLFQLVQE
jgi:hypothetical protein